MSLAVPQLLVQVVATFVAFAVGVGAAYLVFVRPMKNQVSRAMGIINKSSVESRQGEIKKEVVKEQADQFMNLLAGQNPMVQTIAQIGEYFGVDLEPQTIQLLMGNPYVQNLLKSFMGSALPSPAKKIQDEIKMRSAKIEL